MSRLIRLTALALMVATATPGFSQTGGRHVAPANSFASDFQTVPVMGNVPGLGGTFQSYVALLNPTSSSFSIQVALFDSAGVRHDATITLAAGEVRTYDNFLDAVFHFAGGGAATFRSADSAGGTRNNRFIVTTEVRTGGTHYNTTIPALEFAGTNSRSFAPGVNVDSTTRTNIGCFNQSDAPNRVRATVLDSSGVLGSVDLNLPANAWGQTAVGTIVSNGYVQFDPAEAAVCYASVVDNSTNDARFILAAEYKP